MIDKILRDAVDRIEYLQDEFLEVFGEDRRRIDELKFLDVVERIE